MSFLPRMTNLIPSTPSSAPQEAMIASQKAHIDELVQRTRTLDNTVKRLQEQLSNSNVKWQAERKEWADGCDSLMACHRIAHLRTNVLLAQERVALAHERDLTRRERVAVIQRDYNLILFKAREKELEIEADKLREELSGATDRNVALVAELRDKLAEGMRELKEKAALLRDAERVREEAEEQTTRVRTEQAALQAQLSSAHTNVERLTLRFEDAQTAIAEKERVNNDLQQEKANLKVQVEKWKSLDDRGGAEVEKLHKERATLESQVKRLESRLTEEEDKVSAHEKTIQKDLKKVEKLQQALEEQARIAEEAKAAAEAIQHGDAGDAKMNKRLQKLMAALEAQTDKTAKAEEEAALLEEQLRHYKDELGQGNHPDPEAGRPGSRSRMRSGRGPDEDETRDSVHSEPLPAAGDPSKAASVGESDEDNKKVAQKPVKGKGRQRSKPPTSDRNRKRKAPPDDGGTETVDTASEKEKAIKETRSKTRKNQPTAKESQQPIAVDVDPDDAAVHKKKRMRKLNVNIFASAKPDSLDWANQFNLGGGDLAIPTELSPVKVPTRSLAGRSVSTSFR
ncbi:hypothetical protein F5148DRAFT_1151402 [Russula earlei]|uniref:Uncharacterized protein n=1 Tax=Russula earlei TaxID=71964 RepID=A0ACC0U1Z0_9AGAM|nr:hypothetical protein F5148DRAFT_1151402 [Russula earlei]